MSFVARVWTHGESVRAVVASPKSLSDEWAECGADAWHNIIVDGDAMSAGEVMANISFAGGVLALDGRTITVKSTIDIT